jgi:hypothetical protein
MLSHTGRTICGHGSDRVSRSCCCRRGLDPCSFLHSEAVASASGEQSLVVSSLCSSARSVTKSSQSDANFGAWLPHARLLSLGGSQRSCVHAAVPRPLILQPIETLAALRMTSATCSDTLSTWCWSMFVIIIVASHDDASPTLKKTISAGLWCGLATRVALRQLRASACAPTRVVACAQLCAVGIRDADAVLPRCALLLISNCWYNCSSLIVGVRDLEINIWL